jgi:cell division transport system permease protein
MSFNNFRYASREAWTNISRGGLMTLVATSIIAISIFVLGIFLLIFFNLNNVLNNLNSKLDIVAYLRKGLDQSSLEVLNLRMAKISGVKKIDFVAKETAWDQLKENYSNLNLETMVENNPLPDAFKVEVKDITMINVIARHIQDLDGVEDVRYGADIAERIAKFTSFFSLGGLILIGLLGLATVMIIINTIRLTVLARQNEINIMSLVGATKKFIKQPFILEGFYMGFLASLVTVSLLKLSYDLAVLNIERTLPFLPVNLSSGNINTVFVIVFAAGLFLGMLGGYVSVSKSLKDELE